MGRKAPASRQHCDASPAERKPSLPVYGISDLHLPHGTDWNRRDKRMLPADLGDLAFYWSKSVPREAVVLVPGDLTEVESVEEAHPYLEMLDRLPGQKMLVAGNHDWEIGRSGRMLRSACAPYESLRSVMGTAYRVVTPLSPHGLVVCGSCGAWPGMNGGGRLAPCFQTEARRLESALSDACALRQPGDGLAVLLHYPPFDRDQRPTKLSRLVEEAKADLCVYGHLHDASRWPRLFQGRHGSTYYRFVAADYLGLRPRMLGSLNGRGLRVSS